MGGDVILVVDPYNWPTALGAIGFFGLCAGFTTRLLASAARRWPALAHSPFGSAQDGRLAFSCVRWHPAHLPVARGPAP